VTSAIGSWTKTLTAGRDSESCEGANVADKSEPTRSKSQIEADLGATRDRLTSSVEALIDQVHPNRIKQREIGNAKRFAYLELENVKAMVFNARGDLRRDRVVAMAGAGAGFVGLLVILRAIVRRSRQV